MKKTKTKIFPSQPSITQADRTRIAATGILDSWSKCVSGLNNHNPNVDDLKRMVVIEATRIGGPRRDIVEKLVVRVQKAERKTLLQNISVATQDLDLS